MVITKMVEEGKTRDKCGNLIHPVMHEPIVLGFFGAPEALFDALWDKPLLVLTLLRTNKALASFFSNYQDVWRLWTNMLIEKEMGVEAAEIYPFFVIQEHRQTGLDLADIQFMVKRTGDQSYGFKFAPLNRTWKGPYRPPFYIVYYDPLTKLYVEFLNKLPDLFIKNRSLSEYLGVNSLEGPIVVSFLDCFLIASENNILPVLGAYNLDSMRETLAEITKTLDTESLLVLAQDLSRLIEKGERPPKPELIKLDKQSARLYETLLYDKEQGLLKTPQDQKTFFINVLENMSLGATEEKKALIIKYGQPLNCAFCHCETHSVDPLLMRAFCTETCRNLYIY